MDPALPDAGIVAGWSEATAALHLAQALRSVLSMLRRCAPTLLVSLCTMGSLDRVDLELLKALADDHRATVVALAVLVFATGQDQDEVRRETPVSIFHPTFLLLMAGVSNAFLAGDLFNLFVGFEILLFASYVLLTMGGTGARIRAGSIYVVVNLLSSSVFLIALANVYAATGTVKARPSLERMTSESTERHS